MYGKFLVEGDKTVRELLHSAFSIDAIYGLSGWIEKVSPSSDIVTTISETELAEISIQDNPNQVIAIANIPAPVQSFSLGDELYIVCDQLNDPGNAGTIIRIADWFGVQTVIFSENSVDVYNPKVVSAAKGSLFRVKTHVADLKTVFENNKRLPVYAADMEGKSIYQASLPAAAILLIGNEANGISEELYTFVSDTISIPSFGKAESLNAGVATGIIVSEWRRQSLFIGRC